MTLKLTHIDYKPLAFYVFKLLVCY